MEIDYEVSCSTIHYGLLSFLLVSVAAVDRIQVNRVSLTSFSRGACLRYNFGRRKC